MIHPPAELPRDGEATTCTRCGLPNEQHDNAVECIRVLRNHLSCADEAIRDALFHMGDEAIAKEGASWARGRLYEYRRDSSSARLSPPREGAGTTQRELIAAGAMLANVAYNLAQRDHLRPDERESLDVCRKHWDATVGRLAATPSSESRP